MARPPRALHTAEARGSGAAAVRQQRQTPRVDHLHLEPPRLAVGVTVGQRGRSAGR